MEEDGGLSRIKDAGARAAFLKVTGAFSDRGYRLARTTGVVAGFKIYTASDVYLFSACPAQAHVLFYLRKKATDRRPEIIGEARKRFGDALKINNAGEGVLYLRSAEQADRLVEWLVPLFPVDDPA